MTDEFFSCHSCGEGIDIPDRSRFTLSTSRPAVCKSCGAPHVYEAGIQMDQGWVRQQLDELAQLKRQRSDQAK